MLNDIIVSCEQTLFILDEQGLIRYQRRYEYTPSCIYPYHLERNYADVFEDEERSAENIKAMVEEGK